MNSLDDPMSKDLIERIRAAPSRGRRKLVGIAGFPASGKSTFAARLTGALNEQGLVAVNVPMDGFHLDNRLLDAMGLRARKGAPETFDVDGFRALLLRLRTEDSVCFPLFDRGLDISIAAAGVLGPECEIVVIEGNYLLFDEAPWHTLAKEWDLSIWLEESDETVLRRCTQRWIDHGHTAEAALERAERNDLANARRIRAGLLPADIVLRGSG